MLSIKDVFEIQKTIEKAAKIEDFHQVIEIEGIEKISFTDVNF
jgi:hypothetical protein